MQSKLTYIGNKQGPLILAVRPDVETSHYVLETPQRLEKSHQNQKHDTQRDRYSLPAGQELANRPDQMITRYILIATTNLP